MEVTKIPDRILTQKIKPADSSDLAAGTHARLFVDMRIAMEEHKGVGLAANQIGQNIAAFVIDKKLAEENNIPDAFANPEITEYSRETDELEEGCLSIPQFFVPIARSKKIKFKGLTEQGEKIKFRARGFLARVLQHETDHINGHTIKDRQK